MIQPKKRLGSAELLFKQASKMGLDPSWLTPNGLFVVSTRHGERYINNTRSSINPTVGASLSSNKYATRLILERHNLPNIPYLKPKSGTEAEGFLAIHNAIIVKPLKGGGAKDIFIVRNKAQLRELDLSKCILEKYISGKEMRYLVLNGSVIAVHESKYGTSVEEDRYLERVSYNLNSWDPLLVSLSIQVSGLLGLAFSAVDFLVDSSGRHHILEVNSAPGLKWFHAPSVGPVVDVAKLFLEAMLVNNNGTSSWLQNLQIVDNKTA